MIIHNDVSISQILETLIHSERLNIKTCNKFDDIDKLLQESYHLIITDAEIKGIFIYEYLEFLKTKAKNTPIIVLSQINNEFVAKTIKNLGIDYFLRYPLSEGKLNNLIKQLL